MTDEDTKEKLEYNWEQDSWEDTIQRYISFKGKAMLPEQSEHNRVGIKESTAEALAKKNNWIFEIIPFSIGSGVYIRMFQFSPKILLDQSV